MSRKTAIHLSDVHRGVFLHLNVLMQNDSASTSYAFRIPSEPAPPPIQEPHDPPENPDVPVREPDPDDPGQI